MKMSRHDPHVILHLCLLYLGIGVGAGVKVKVIYTTTNGLPIVKWTKICLCVTYHSIFSGLVIIELFLEMPNILEIICLKCQFFKKL
jgi:hypothetical protein